MTAATPTRAIDVHLFVRGSATTDDRTAQERIAAIRDRVAVAARRTSTRFRKRSSDKVRFSRPSPTATRSVVQNEKDPSRSAQQNG